ncbi:HemK methyltransferase family member 2 [Babesia sp. Xinjiang]|uniref:HemK methyltransferase family member 2 n=1 Tax=Babesia sp. Xinjiang TaxID=462227 RepID=UPI000A2550EF|nr:HemK methyltransferase family member 2 [Babesia sp. Xinjiang]ORM40821.1 HemK methyltransferase family member 2 [Babesia sp. Xinjiang]
MECQKRHNDRSRINIDCSHVETGYYKDTVYCPDEDTYLFTEALQMDVKHLINQQINVVLEIGCGSGYISTYLLKLLEELKHGNAKEFYNQTDTNDINSRKGTNELNPFVIAIDVNPFANRATWTTMQRNGVTAMADTITMDMFTALNKQRSRTMVDVIMFNPPYVPSEGGDNSNKHIDAAWDGGVMGREVIDRFIADVGVGLNACCSTKSDVQEYLSQEGTVYLLVEKRNDINTVLKIVHQRGFDAKVICSKQILGECLYIIRFCRS